MESVLCLFFLLCIFGPRSFLGWVWRGSRFPSHSLDRKDPWRFLHLLFCFLNFLSTLSSAVCVITRWQLFSGTEGMPKPHHQVAIHDWCLNFIDWYGLLLNCEDIFGGLSSETMTRNVCFQFGRAPLGCAQALWSIRAGQTPVWLFGTDWMFGFNTFSSTFKNPVKLPFVTSATFISSLSLEVKETSPHWF